MHRICERTSFARKGLMASPYLIGPTRGRTAVAAALLIALGATPALADEDPSGAPRLKESEHFTIDPVVDGLLVIGGFTFSELLSLIISTGEIVPQAPGNPDRLLAID